MLAIRAEGQVIDSPRLSPESKTFFTALDVYDPDGTIQARRSYPGAVGTERETGLGGARHVTGTELGASDCVIDPHLFRRAVNCCQALAIGTEGGLAATAGMELAPVL